MNYNNYEESLNSVLNSCIEIESAKISRQLTIPHQICFYLNAERLEQIGQFKAHQTNQIKFCLSASNLANLRHYALSNLPLAPWSISAASALTFSTEYSFDGEETATTLFRSVIDLEGKISQQIKQELAQNPTLLEQISEAHYWLIAEIMDQLPLTSQSWYSWLFVVGFAIAMVIVSSLIWYFIPLNYLLKLIICLGVFFISKFISKILVTKYFKSWVIYHLVGGLLAKSTRLRKWGLKILSFLL